MVIEASTILGLDIRTSEGVLLGSVKKLTFDEKQTKIVACRTKPATFSKNKKDVVMFENILSFDRRSVFVDSSNSLVASSAELDEIAKQTGPVLGVAAQTESGAALGQISDVLIDSASGLIIRFYVRRLLNERIIPRPFLVAITPKAVVFKDSVNQPTFDQVAALEGITAL